MTPFMQAALPPSRPWGRRLLIATLIASALLISWLSISNLFLNFGLPALLGTASERVQVRYRWAFMSIPGQVFVYGLDIHSRGQRGVVIVRADRATGWIWMGELWDRRFRASQLRAQGVTFLSFPYEDEPAEPPGVGSAQREQAEAPLYSDPTTAPQLSTAPPAPDTAPPNRRDPRPDRPQWSLRLDDIVAVDLHEIRYGHYQMLGDLDVSASFLVEPPFTDLEAVVLFDESRIAVSGDGVAERATGEARLSVSRMDKRLQGNENLAALSGRVILEADVRDLSFVDFYLQEVPWLSFGGIGTTQLEVVIDEGKLAPGSELDASFPNLIVRLLGTVVHGAGTIRGWVENTPDDRPNTGVDVDLRSFDLLLAGATEPLIRGDSLLIDLRSPDVALDAPFAVDVGVVLSPSRIPTVSAFNTFLPADIGLALRSGEASVHGELQSTAADGSGWGRLKLTSDDLVAQVDDLELHTELDLDATLVDARFEDGVYGLTGTTVHLRRLDIHDRTDPEAGFSSRGWDSTLSVTSGAVRLQNPIYFDLSMRIRATDSGPFVAVIGQKTPLPGWVRSAMTVDDLAGEARLQLGATSMELGPFAIRGGTAYELKLRYLREGALTYGAVFTRAGPLSVGIGLHPTGSNVRLFGATRWFDEQEQTHAWRE